MGIEANVIADSISNGIRLTTLQVKFHRFCLPEFNTHRVFSRNFSSSRAIPFAKILEQVKTDPAVPIHWGKNQSGMQASEEIDDAHHVSYNWKQDAKYIASLAESHNDYGLHKQVVNRMLEPYQWVNGIVTATEWDNFFALRDHEAAQPEIRALAQAMRKAMDESTPNELQHGEWHLPYIYNLKQMDIEPDPMFTFNDGLICLKSELPKMSSAYCARASYNKHDGSKANVHENLELYNQLVTRPYTDKRGFSYSANDPIHASPCEHQATPMASPTYIGNCGEKGITHTDRQGNFWSGNFRGWCQYRQLL